MKKILLITILSAVSFLMKAQTTQQEYNYCRNSFLSDNVAGRGYLPGYKIIKYYGNSAPSKPVDALLFNDAAGKTKAIIVIVSSKDLPPTVVVIPTVSNQNMWNQTIKDIAFVNSQDQRLAMTLTSYVMGLTSTLIARVDELEGHK